MASKKAQQPQQRNLNVMIPDQLRLAVHANVVRITTTSDGEVFLDFVFTHPQDVQEGAQQGVLVSRVALPHSIARRLLALMEQQLGKVIKE